MEKNNFFDSILPSQVSSQVIQCRQSFITSDNSFACFSRSLNMAHYIGIIKGTYHVKKKGKGVCDREKEAKRINYMTAMWKDNHTMGDFTIDVDV